MTHHYRPAKFEDCAELAPNMRKQDAEEVWASSGLNPIGALQQSFKGSYECNSIIHEDGDVVGMFGVSDNKIFAMPWLLGSDKLLDTKKEFIPQAVEWVDRMSSLHPILTNFVCKKNTVAIRWLETLGFDFVKTIDKFGVGQIPFIQFVRITKCVE
jgi:hypothetical protein